MEIKRVMTLIGKEQAVIGKTFRLYSIPNECKQCKLFNICVARLRPGRVYRIAEVKHVGLPQPNKCLLTGEDMVPIIAEELPIVIPIPTKLFIEGVVITYVKSLITCNDARKYLPNEEVLKEGTKVRIVKETGRVRCNNENYILAEVIPLD